MKLLVALLLCSAWCLSGCDKIDWPSHISQLENTSASQLDESNKEEATSKPSSQSEIVEKEQSLESSLSEEEVMQLGEQALAKWIQIGHSLNPPLYNTNLKEIGQEECRQIYSVYLYHNNLYESLVYEETIPQNTNLHWTELTGIEQFSQNYFGCHFNSLQSNMSDNKINGDHIAFYFNARFNVLAQDLIEYKLFNCTEIEDRRFVAEIHVNFQPSELEEYFGEPNFMLNFFIQDNVLCFSSASFDNEVR